MLVINNNLHFSLYNKMMLYTIYFIFLILQNCLAYFLAVQYGQKVFFIVFHTIMNIHTIFQRIIPFRMFFFYHSSWWPFSYGASISNQRNGNMLLRRLYPDSCWPTSMRCGDDATRWSVLVVYIFLTMVFCGISVHMSY